MTVLHRLRTALLLLALVLILGVTGYVTIEGWSAFDALYMTVITLATIGYGETRTLTPAGRAFTMVLIVSGVSVGAYAAAAYNEVLLRNLLTNVLGRRRMERELAQLKDHFIICGWGRMGQELVQQFRSKQVPFVVIEVDEDKCRRLAEKGIRFVQGDASDDQVLRAAGIERAQGLVTVAPKDADNIFITLSARSLNPRLYIVARSVYDADVHKLEIAGADRVISPYVIGARRIAAALFHPATADFLDREVDGQVLEWELQDLTVRAEAAFVGMRLRDCGIREKTGCTVLAVRNAGASNFISNPDSDTLLAEGSTLIALGTADQLARLEALAGCAGRARQPVRRRS
jgi:voltage-gated potassium channel